MGEALHESSPCMPHLSVEQQNPTHAFDHSLSREGVVFGGSVVDKTKREPSVWLKISKRTTPEFAKPMLPSLVFLVTLTKKFVKPTQFFNCVIFSSFVYRPECGRTTRRT